MDKLQKELLLIRAFNNARSVTKEMYEIYEFPQLFALKRKRILKQMKSIVMDLNKALGKAELTEEDLIRGIRMKQGTIGGYSTPNGEVIKCQKQ